mmetsp:Transcript_41658/g.42461  ORF Transcript_41658/g.42461 Transcript_41658/m.42461 type:complete len:124 (-) Transcript_41658:127-498(-)
MIFILFYFGYCFPFSLLYFFNLIFVLIFHRAIMRVSFLICIHVHFCISICSRSCTIFVAYINKETTKERTDPNPIIATDDVIGDAADEDDSVLGIFILTGTFILTFMLNRPNASSSISEKAAD